MSQHRKTITALITGILTWCTASLGHGVPSTQQWVALAVALAGALGVYHVQNDVDPGEDSGAFDTGGVVAACVALAILLIILRVLHLI